MLHALLTGLVLGTASGLIPGPLQALVISQSAQHGWRGGMQVALAPLITDALIVAVTVLLVSRVPAEVLHVMTLVGALVLIYIAYGAWQASSVGVWREDAPASGPAEGCTGDGLRPRGAKGLWQAVLVNALNPHAWLFWALVGAPLFVRFGRASGWSAAGFVFTFYLLLVGSKVGLAVAVDRGVAWTGPGGRRFILRTMAVLLCVLAIAMGATGVAQLFSS